MDILSLQVLALGAVACIVLTYVVRFMKKDSEELGIEKKQTISLVDIEDEMEDYEEAPVLVEFVPVSAPVVTPASLLRMTKLQIEAHGRTQGVELDRRMTKVNMLADLESRTK